MGLKGRLEDLPLLDMLQIIAFSKKSGYLRISGTKGRGAVMLKEGRILFSYSWSTIPGLQDLVRQPEKITPAVIREHVEASLRELGGMREGRFQFELADPTSEEFGGVRIQPFLLPQGLDAQEILLDLAVEMDNERREATSLLEMAFQGDFPPGEPTSETEVLEVSDVVVPDAGVGEPVPAFSPEPPPFSSPAVEAGGDLAPMRQPETARTTVVLVDDEAPVREVVSEELAARGYRVFTASNPAAGANVVRERLESGEKVMVVVDLKMPTSSERSFFGGFELVRRLRRRDAGVQVLLMAESLSEKAKARAKELGIRRLVFKPTLSKIDAQLYVKDLRSFASAVDEQLQRLIGDGGAAKAGNGRSEPLSAETSRMRFLSAMTRKLVEPGGSTDVSRLVMMAAERFLERGVLFVVKGDVARGLAAFGIGKTDQQSALAAQRVVIDIAPSPAFTELVRRGSAYRVNDEIPSLDATLFAEIGRGLASEAILIPLLYNRAILLVLYGDNAKSGRSLGDLNALELFIAQAGMALENKLLQRKLSAIDAQLVEDLSHDARA